MLAAISEVLSLDKKVPQKSHVQSTPTVREIPLRVYSGFVPNHVFFGCHPGDVRVYAAAQYLAVSGRPVTPKTILAKCPLPLSTIKNALTRLKQADLIQKNGKGYLFFHSKLQQTVSAQQLIANNLGYYIKAHDLRDTELTNEEILSLSVMGNLILSTPRMRIPYIAKIFRKSEKQTKLLLKALVTKGYLLRTRDHVRSPYRYEIVPHSLRNRLTSQGTTTMPDLSTDNPNRTNHDTSNRTNHDTTYINGVFINKYNPDSSNTHQQAPVALLRDPFLKKELEEVIIPYTEKLARSLPHLSERVESELKAKTTEHTDALLARNKELRETKRISKETINNINKIEIDLSLLEIKKKKIEHGLNTWLPYTHNPRAVLSQRLISLNVEEINILEGAVRAITPKFSTESHNNMAFCLLFNSLVKDIADRYETWYRNDDKGVRAKRDAIAKSITSIKTKGYELNVAVYPESGKRLKKLK